MSGLSLNIQRMRREEDRIAQAQANILEASKVESRVTFEHRTERQITDRLMRTRIAEANKRLKAKVDVRRAALAKLLEQERYMYQRDIEASFETPEQVKERIFAHARALKENREAARRKLAAELEDKRFRISSDILRGRASAVTAERVAFDRIEQLQQKQRIQEMEHEREQQESAAAIAASQGYLDEQKVIAEAKRRIAAESAHVLDQQIAAKRDLNAAEKSYEDSLVQAMLQTDRAAADAQRNAAIARRQQAREAYERTMLYNASERGTKGHAAAKEAEEDKANLEAILAREAAEAAAEIVAKQERRKAGIEFKKQLEAQMSIAAEDNGWMDKFYQEEFDKEWAKRQQQWDREAAARKALLDEVTQGRLAQIEDKKHTGGAERARDDAMLAYFAKVDAEAEAKEAEKQAKRKQGLRNQGMYNRVELEANKASLEKEKQEAYLEWRLAQKFEREYEAKVQKILKEPAAPPNFGIKKQNLY